MRQLRSRLGSLTPALVPLVLILAAWLLLRPGLGGSFLLDDFPNLPALEDVSLTDWSGGDLARFLGSNLSGPTGRPVAMLSFLPHEAYWPFSARPFLRTNLLLHMVIGLLVLGISRRLALLAGMDGERRATAFGTVVALLWVLHPLQASTVFYTVQRMAQLSALFSLAAVYSYVVGRQRLAAGAPRSGWAWIALAPLLALVGAYAKENAILVPVALLLVEYWFLDSPHHRARWIGYLRVGMLWLPTLVIAVYLVDKIGSDAYLKRDFTATERLMTEARILVDYLDALVRPAPITGGLFNDTYPISTSPWHPLSTLLAIGACAGLVTWSLAYRHRQSLISWGVLFFFGMHLAESSTIALELYYEHRNYLPSVGIMTAAAALGFRLYDYRGYLGAITLTAMLAMVAVTGHLRAQNWGHPLRQAEIWTRINPESPRAWQNLALRNHENGLRSGAHYALTRWKELRPEAALPDLALLAYTCPSEPVSPARWSTLRQAAAQGRFSHGLLRTLSQLVNQSVTGDCRGLRPDEVHVLLRALLDNPNVESPFVRQRLWHLDGQLLLAPGFIDDAMAAFERSHQHLSDPPMRMMQARYLARRGYVVEALELLAAAEEAPAKSIYGPFHVYWLVNEPGQIEALARRIRSDAEAQQVGTSERGTETSGRAPGIAFPAPVAAEDSSPLARAAPTQPID